ncbi:MAG TPA: trypsin-like peptidase domain-containing protein [Ferruginibacter sp.]|nr:trypsin-like peptidase domain-containing protein [Ferruginibacter sp.]
MKLKEVAFTIAISAVTAASVMWGYNKFTTGNNTFGGQVQGVVPSNYHYAGLPEGTPPPPGIVDFTGAAAVSLPTVVHIKTKTNAKQVSNNLPSNPFGDAFGNDDIFKQFFGQQSGIIPEQRASGSGVIISADGYIVTNNHVVADADELTVTLNNKKTYTAKVVGTDPSYDLAVIKIDAGNLPFLLYGNSDEAKIGQWVLAIGYPLNLETTVTAGIISAKGRSLGLNKGTRTSSPVESYIQTDAAVNQGNSGGALINTNGQLIGINSAIASPTGFYSGYSYAIPVNIVRKVVDDLIKYGTVQRAFLGVAYAPDDISDDDKTKEGIKDGDGVFVTDISKGGAAEAAGIKKGDFITKVDGVPIGSSSELVEQISRFKPADKISISYTRNGDEKTVDVTLKNNAGNYDIVKEDNSAISKLGADLATLDPKKAKEYGIPGGVIVKKINAGALTDQTRMRDGFIIIKVDGKDVKSVDEFKKITGDEKSMTITGFYPGYDGLYDYPISLGD